MAAVQGGAGAGMQERWEGSGNEGVNFTAHAAFPEKQEVLRVEVTGPATDAMQTVRGSNPPSVSVGRAGGGRERRCGARVEATSLALKMPSSRCRGNADSS